jgi:iron(III) transport system ATP-binding protein
MTEHFSPGIEFIAVKKSYVPGPLTDKTPLAVKGISFVAAPGTLTTILGPSGCGKTTTLRMIAGLEQASAGQIRIHGQDVTGLSPAARNVSMVFQSYALFPHMKVLDNVMYGLLASDVNKTEAGKRALAALESVGLTGYDTRWPSELSGGQQQRVAVARALVLEPKVLLFDEPLSNLDARLRRTMREEIRALQQRLKLTVVYVTHDQGEAMAVSDQIIVMNAGLIAQMGTPRELYYEPHDEFVAAFMGDALMLNAEASAPDQLLIGPLRVRSPRPHRVSGQVRVAVRPEAWRFNAPADNSLRGIVQRCAFLGSHAEYEILTELGELLMIDHSAQRKVEIGESVQLGLEASSLAVVNSTIAQS